MQQLLILACIVSFGITFFLTPLVILFAKKLGLVDDPKRRYHPAAVHTGLVPRAGGLSLFLGITLPILFFLPLSTLTLSLVLSACILVIVGLFDDRQDIHPTVRLATNALACFLVIIAGVTIPYVTHPFHSGVLHLDSFVVSLGSLSFAPLPLLLSFIWIYWTMNIIGWSAGVDGQLPGVVVIGATVLGILSLRYSLKDPSQWYVTILSAIVAGSFLGFLPWNFYPQRIMPGYSGKTLAGFFFSPFIDSLLWKTRNSFISAGNPHVRCAIYLIPPSFQRQIAHLG